MFHTFSDYFDGINYHSPIISHSPIIYNYSLNIRASKWTNPPPAVPWNCRQFCFERYARGKLPHPGQPGHLSAWEAQCVISVGQWLLDFSGWSIWLIHVNSTLFNYSVDIIINLENLVNLNDDSLGYLPCFPYYRVIKHIILYMVCPLVI